MSRRSTTVPSSRNDRCIRNGVGFPPHGPLCILAQTQGTSRTTVHERSGAGVAVRGGSRTAVGVRHAASDDVIIHRKKARRHVYSEPSTTIIRKKRYVKYHEPSSVVIHKRRAGVAVGGGTSTHTTVRSGKSTTVGGSSTTRESVGAGARGCQGASGEGNVGAGSSSQGSSGRTGRAPSGGGSSGSSGGSESTSGRR